MPKNTSVIDNKFTTCLTRLCSQQMDFGRNLHPGTKELVGCDLEFTTCIINIAISTDCYIFKRML